MISYRSLLEIKRIFELEELKVGEIAFLKDKLVLKDFNENIKYIDLFNGESVFYIYGIRVPVELSPNDMTDNSIERVFIKRRINSNCEIIDEEFIGDETNLNFELIENNQNSVGVFKSNKLNSLHPFNLMSIKDFQIQPTKTYIAPNEPTLTISCNFTKLPLFFKNKQKTRTIDNISYDYYLISDVWFDDFYPVESHLKQDGSYASSLWLESDWRLTNLSTIQNGATPSKYFDGDYVYDADRDNKPTFIINELVWFDYLYYIYMIKTASFKPILSALENSSFSINDSITYIYYDITNSLFKSVFNNVDTDKEFSVSVNNVAISSFSSNQIVLEISNEQDDVIENIKNNLPDGGLFCLVVTNNLSGLTTPPISPSYISMSCAEFYGVVNKNDIEHPNRITFNSYGDLEEPDGYQNLLSSQNLYLLLIKTIPPIECNVNNNQITNSGDFCIDNIKNIFPVYFSNGMFKSYDSEYLSTSDYIFSLPYNYSIYIDSGSHSSWFNPSTSRPQNLLNKLRTKIQYNYFDGVFADYKENTQNVVNTENNNQINCVISFDNKMIKQKDIYSNGVQNSSDITNFSTRQGCIRGCLDGHLFENSGDSYPWQEYELFTGCLLKDKTITIGWNNFTLNQRDTKENGTKEVRVNNDCVTRLMFFE